MTLAKANDFVVNTTEKVLRLCDFLTFVSAQGEKLPLILKGGTAINFCLLNLPRLSVDADFDFALNLPKEEVTKERSKIKNWIQDYMRAQGCQLSSRSKFTHALDSFAFSYETLSNSKDILKIEINYSNRCHVLNPVTTKTLFDLSPSFYVSRLSDEELIGSKINALLSRTTPRDLFDTYTLSKEGKITNHSLVKKIALFYLALSMDPPFRFEEIRQKAIERIEQMDFHKMKETLIPVLRLHPNVNISDMKKSVIDLLTNMFTLNASELAFVEQFNAKIFQQNLLFENYPVNDLANHPMVRWKLRS